MSNGKQRIEFPAEVLRDILDYDPDIGVLTWKVRDICSEHWTEGGARNFNAQFAGKEAGFLKPVKNRDYVRREMKLPDGRNYLCHRVIWAWMTGEWPSELIDHKDQDPLNNRWDNLQESTYAGNQLNVRRRADNVSGIVGMSWSRGHKEWMVSIQKGEERHTLRTKDLFEACCFRRYKEAEMGFSDNHGMEK